MAARHRNKHKPAVMPGPVEIPDAGHELVIERVAAIDVAKAASSPDGGVMGTGATSAMTSLCLRAGGRVAP